MNKTEYDFLASFLKQRSGLVLAGDKTYLLESRLTPILGKHGIASFADLISTLKSPAKSQVAEEVVDAMTTNESFFFRDKTPFDLFQQTMLPAMLQARASQRTLKIWCAAASTGQEPYSLAMILKEEKARLAGWSTPIVGTDISDTVLTKAKQGLYTQFEVQRGLPVNYLLNYFKQSGETWQVSQEIRSMVQYRKLNLLDNFSSLGQNDIVFCRNVLIYFDQQTKIDILNRIARSMPPDGYLVLGAAESVIGLTNAFEPVRGKRGLYMVAGAAAKAAAAGADAAPVSATSRLSSLRTAV